MKSTCKLSKRKIIHYGRVGAKVSEVLHHPPEMYPSLIVVVKV
jgi:hypothetical protein